jgi:cell division protease FtsH
MKNLSRTNLIVLALLGVCVIFLVSQTATGPSGEQIEYSAFQQDIRDKRIAQVTIQGQYIHGTRLDESKFYSTGPADHALTATLLDEHNTPYKFQVEQDDSLWLTAALTLLPLGIMVILFFWLMRNIQGSSGRAMNFGKAKAKLHDQQGRKYTFDDVAGIEESKEELSEIIEFLKDPGKFTRLGGRIPKGVLLMGSPGTGKTLLAKAVAGEAGVPFFSISGSDFVEMFVGVGASRVRDLFEQGKKYAPCIIFIDEIDAVGRHRGAGLGGGHDEREQTLNQLLVEMDGFDGNQGVILIAATNRPDVLDPALLRPGRFDRRVMVPPPDMKGRKEILTIHTRKLPLADGVELQTIAKGTPGFSGADLENLANEAALIAARKDKREVEAEDFEEAREKIFLGPERRSMVVPDWERKNTAYHEAGHAIVAHLLPGHDPVHKVTIVPRGRALGVTWTLPSEDRLSQTRQDLYKSIAMAMGGRAAEEIALESITGGAKNDIQKATQMARHMVCELGMSADLGPVQWGNDGDEVFLGRQMTQGKAYSEDTARRIDLEVKRIVTRAYDTARNILKDNIHVLHSVAQILMEQDSIGRDEFAEIVEKAGPVPAEGLSWMLA